MKLIKPLLSSIGISILSLLRLTPHGFAQTVNFSVLDDFVISSDGTSPGSSLVQGTDGNFYGTTPLGGAYNVGTIFSVTPAGALTTLYTFTGSADGSFPSALVQGTDGNFYGTTGYPGTFFSITPAGQLTTLYSFGTFTDGGSNPGNVIQGTDGDFYATVADADGYGNVISITPAGEATYICDFDNGAPDSNLVQGTDGNFYGTTSSGGANGFGTFFSVTPSGTLTTLYSFTTETGGTDGGHTGLVQGTDGNFYGTTSSGGSDNSGAFFSLTPSGSLITLYTFTDFADPGGLVQGTDGNFYGTTGLGQGTGTIFSITPAGALNTVYRFTGSPDGAGPFASLVKGADGKLYGSTVAGGAYGQGTLFSMTYGGTLMTLHSFIDDGNGAEPLAGLAQGSDGNFYGTTSGGGSSGNGSVFSVSPAGALTTLYSFGPFNNANSGTNTDGAQPQCVLVQGNDGKFYGTTFRGGTSDVGTVFSITSAGALSTLYTFTGETDGGNPYAGLIQGSDGNFYGTTTGQYSSYDSDGTVFRITPAGVLTTLYTFGSQPGDGVAPPTKLVQGTDGNFYGTTSYGGANGYGTIFSVTPAGVSTTLYNFPVSNTVNVPFYTSLVQGTDGNFYGAVVYGGAYSDGAIFSITPAGVLTTLYNFSATTFDEQTGFYTNSDGAGPSGLALGADGNFYGATSGGGANGDGTIFSITPAGVLTTLYSLSPATGSQSGIGLSTNSDGVAPLALVQGTDGKFYGTTTTGGLYSDGVVFAFTVNTVNPPAITSSTIANGVVGSSFSYQITASNSPTSFGATGLPSGLGVNPASGLISGTPAASGTFSVSLSATNSGGTGTATFTLTVAPKPIALPVITSGLTAPAEAGKVFFYQIIASNNPTSYQAGGLPSRLSFDATTGVISGKPSVGGVFSVVLSATNASGTTTAQLTLQIALPVATLKVSVGDVTEGSRQRGEFTLILSEPQTKLVVVHYKAEGDALAGIDYERLSGAAKFKPGETIKHLYIVPLGDLDGASEKVVKLKLEEDPGYTVGTKESEKVKVLAEP